MRSTNNALADLPSFFFHAKGNDLYFNTLQLVTWKQIVKFHNKCYERHRNRNINEYRCPINTWERKPGVLKHSMYIKDYVLAVSWFGPEEHWDVNRHSVLICLIWHSSFRRNVYFLMVNCQPYSEGSDSSFRVEGSTCQSKKRCQCKELVFRKHWGICRVVCVILSRTKWNQSLSRHGKL